MALIARPLAQAVTASLSWLRVKKETRGSKGNFPARHQSTS